jgi:hypothetical protein
MKVFINGSILGLCAKFPSRFTETNVVPPPVVVVDWNAFNSRLPVNKENRGTSCIGQLLEKVLFYKISVFFVALQRT